MAAQTNSSHTEVWSTCEKEYHSFSSLSLRCNDNDAAQLATPALAMAWADAIITYWKNALSHQHIRSDRPLYLLDLNPGRGQFVWLLLKALHARLGDTPFQPCYLACSPQLEILETLSQHPYLQTAIADGSFDTAYLPPSCESLHLQYQNHTLLRSDNPVVVVGTGYFQTLPSELFGVHHGQIMEGRVSATDDGNDLSELRLAYQWKEAAAPAIAAPLLEKYLARCTSASLLLPLNACAQLDALGRISAGRYLLLSADRAVCNEQAIRLGALRPPDTLSDNGISIPVNTHALHLHQQQHGALTWHQQLNEDGIAVFVAQMDGNAGNDQSHAQAFSVMTRQLSTAHPDDFFHAQMPAIDMSKPANAPLYLSALRRSHYNPHLLKNIIKHLLDSGGAMDECLRRQWQNALALSLENIFPTTSNDGLYYQISLLAIQFGDFDTAKKSLQLSLNWYGEDATELYLLAWCEAASGGVPLARQLLQQALLLEPQHEHGLRLLSQLEQRLERRQRCRWYLPHAAQHDMLRLEPLGTEHAPGLFYEYRDEQIGIMTRLPEFSTVEQVEDWIVEQQKDERRASFAVMHACWGFVGIVSAHCADQAGYFYFWTGAGFQGQGMGQQAASLLFSMLEQQGIGEMFTSAYEENTRSVHALKKLGFEKMALQAKAPDETLIFFHRAPSLPSPDASVLKKSIRDLCRAIESPLVFIDSLHEEFEPG